MRSKFYWLCTCEACPEQYDIYCDDQLIAYFRYRYGNIEVHPYINGEIDWNQFVYKISFGGPYDGCLDKNDYKDIKSKVNKAIIKFLK